MLYTYVRFLLLCFQPGEVTLPRHEEAHITSDLMDSSCSKVSSDWFRINGSLCVRPWAADLSDCRHGSGPPPSASVCLCLRHCVYSRRPGDIQPSRSLTWLLIEWVRQGLEVNPAWIQFEWAFSTWKPCLNSWVWSFNERWTAEGVWRQVDTERCLRDSFKGPIFFSF